MRRRRLLRARADYCGWDCREDEAFGRERQTTKVLEKFGGFAARVREFLSGFPSRIYTYIPLCGYAKASLYCGEFSRRRMMRIGDGKVVFLLYS